MMIKVLHLIKDFNYVCGISKMLYTLISLMNPEEVSSVVIFRKGNSLERLDALNIKYYKINLSSKALFFYNFVKLITIIRRNKIDVIHSHNRIGDVYAYLLSKLFNLPAISTVHSVVKGRKILSYKLKNIISVSEYVKFHIENEFDYKGNIYTIYNFVNPNEVKVTIEKEEMLKKLGLSNNDFILGYVGRFDFEEKGVDIILKALSREEIRKDLILLLIGEGKDKNKIIELKNNCKSKIILCENVHDIYNYYNIINLLILPSRIEPFGLVLLEAGMMKLPCLAANTGGIKEIIIDGKNGILFNKDDLNDFTKKLKLILNNYDKVKEFGAELQKTVLSQFNSDSAIKKIINLYKSLQIEKNNNS